MLMLMLLAVLPVALAQDTGGFYIGPASINRETEGQCTDNKGQGIPEGLLFTPGPDECQVCTCLRQMPVLCRTVLCAPPKNCLSLRVGDACCQWICDEWESTRGSANDIGLRLVASAITAIFSLSLLFFLIYRLRQRKLRGRQNHLEAESYNSVVGQQDDCWQGETQMVNYEPDWGKADDNTFSRPFPPSYDEAMEHTDPQSQSLGHDAPSPPYSNISQDPVISNPVVMGRLVLPPCVSYHHSFPRDGNNYPPCIPPSQDPPSPAAVSYPATTLPSVLRRIHRGMEAGNVRGDGSSTICPRGRSRPTTGGSQEDCNNSGSGSVSLVNSVTAGFHTLLSQRPSQQGRDDETVRGSGTPIAATTARDTRRQRRRRGSRHNAEGGDWSPTEREFSFNSGISPGSETVVSSNLGSELTMVQTPV